MNSVNFLLYSVVTLCSGVSLLAAFNADFDNEIKLFDYEHSYEKLLDHIKRKNGKYNDDGNGLTCTIYKRGNFIIISNCFCDDYEEFVQKTNDYQMDKHFNEKFKQETHAHDNNYMKNNYYDANKYSSYNKNNNYNYGKLNKRETGCDIETNDFFGFNELLKQYQIKSIDDSNYNGQFKRSISYQQPYNYENNF